MTLPLMLSCLSPAVVETECERSSATTYFWYRETLDISNSISESGGLNWKMTLCLLVAWSLVGLAMIKGIQSSGKVGVGGHLSLAGLCPGSRTCLDTLSCPALGYQRNAVSPGMVTPTPQLGSPLEGSRIRSKGGSGKRFRSTDTCSQASATQHRESP